MLQYKEVYASTARLGRISEPTSTHGRTATFLSGEEHPEVFKLLATSDEFRAALQADPCATLAEHRIHIDPEMLPDHVTLPEKNLFVLGEEGGSQWLGLMV